MERISLKGAGIEIAADAAGPADGPLVIFIPGSGQTRQSWGKALAEAGARGFRAIAMDLRGHGDSQWSPDGRYELDIFADDLRALIGELDRAPMVVGASLGGLTAMKVAGNPPFPVRALVLVDVTPRVEMEGANEVVAFMESGQDGFASIDEAAEAVSAYLPHRQRPKSNAGLARNLRLREDGRYYWHYDPAFLRMGDKAKENAGAPNPFEASARALTIPVLLIKGGRSRIVTNEGAREFLEMVPHADFVDIDGAHHMVAGDANDAFNEAVFAFLEREAAKTAA